jgi:serine phosphatase RsbU (regulator of sigma subunit)
MKKCRLCKQDIEDDAKKCDKCGSYQTYLGRFVHIGIPIISVLLALVSWGQTYLENQAKKDAIEGEKEATEIAAVAEEQKEVAYVEREIALKKADQYNEALVQIEEDVNSMKQMNVHFPENLQRLNTITKKIELSREQVRNLDERPVRRVEEE